MSERHERSQRLLILPLLGMIVGIGVLYCCTLRHGLGPIAQRNRSSASSQGGKLSDEKIAHGTENGNTISSVQVLEIHIGGHPDLSQPIVITNREQTIRISGTIKTRKNSRFYRDPLIDFRPLVPEILDPYHVSERRKLLGPLEPLNRSQGTSLTIKSTYTIVCDGARANNGDIRKYDTLLPWTVNDDNTEIAFAFERTPVPLEPGRYALALRISNVPQELATDPQAIFTAPNYTFGTDDSQHLCELIVVGENDERQ